MIPTREDLIRLLAKQPQVGVADLATAFVVQAADILRVLKRGDDFEPCAPREQDGQDFAWRLSSLACDPRVRAAALTHQRASERPPQMRQFHNTGVARVQPTKGATGGNVLVAWMRENPGRWTLDQIAHGRGCTVGAVRSLLRIHRQYFTEERLRTKGRPVVLSLKPHFAA